MQWPTFLSRFGRSKYLIPTVKCRLSSPYGLYWNHIVSPPYRSYNTSTGTHINGTSAVKLIRNAGVIAHIDAGKTTTTERMLFLAHRTHQVGEVDRGDTVTDYLPEERERGISILSAAACLTWRQHTLNLIDTPGHVDFTMEVERSLTVMDGAVVILDGTEGVQAQTRTVWHQADRYHLPRLVFINKFDRTTASLDLCVSSLSSQLSSPTRYVLLQWPLFESDLLRGNGVIPGDSNGNITGKRRFIGLVDLISMDLKDWSKGKSVDDAPVTMNLLQTNQGFILPKTMQAIWDARINLMTQLTEVDECFADQFLSVDHLEHLPSHIIQTAVKKATHSGHIIPILVGSSRQGIGVETLLDAIVDYLPDPSFRPLPAAVQQVLQNSNSAQLVPDLNNTNSSKVVPNTSDPLVMLVFKIFFDPHRGALSLVRIYSGSVKRDTHISNWSRLSPSLITEKVHNVFQLTGDRQEAVGCAGLGSIVALAGLESTHSGDLLGPPVLRNSSLVENSPVHFSQSDESSDAVQDDGTFSLPYSEFSRCDPVVYAALEPATFSALKKLEHALQCMQREDPSFVAKLNQETGQWTVGGMGDLHLEIILSRLKREHKVDARFGPLLIAYKECPVIPTTAHTPLPSDGFGFVTGLLNGTKKTVGAAVTITPSSRFNPQIHIDRALFGLQDPGGQSSYHGAIVRLHQSVRKAALSALENAGPLLRSPVVHVTICLRRLLVVPLGLIPAEVSDISDLESLLITNRFPAHQLTSGGTLVSLCRSAVIAAILDGIRKIADWCLLEPMVELELRLPIDTSESLSSFLGDLSSRRAEITSVSANGLDTEHTAYQSTHHIITALAPLSELVGYSASVRGLSSGRADIHLRLAEYRPVGATHQAHLLGRFRWSPVSV